MALRQLRPPIRPLRRVHQAFLYGVPPFQWTTGAAGILTPSTNWIPSRTTQRHSICARTAEAAPCLPRRLARLHLIRNFQPPTATAVSPQFKALPPSLEPVPFPAAQ